MNFSTGQIIFMILFIVAFAIGIGWSYWKDRKIIAQYYKGYYKLFIYIVVVLGGFYLLVKAL